MVIKLLECNQSLLAKIEMATIGKKWQLFSIFLF
jgi:hypothetical protein